MSLGCIAKVGPKGKANVALDMRGMAVVGETELVVKMEAVGGGTRCMHR